MAHEAGWGPSHGLCLQKVRSSGVGSRAEAAQPVVAKLVPTAGAHASQSALAPRPLPPRFGRQDLPSPSGPGEGPRGLTPAAPTLCPLLPAVPTPHQEQGDGDERHAGRPRSPTPSGPEPCHPGTSVTVLSVTMWPRAGRHRPPGVTVLQLLEDGAWLGRGTIRVQRAGTQAQPPRPRPPAPLGEHVPRAPCQALC